MNSLFIATEKGKILRINPSDIPISSLIDKEGKQKSRKPKGIKLINLNENDKVSSITLSENEPLL